LLENSATAHDLLCLVVVHAFLTQPGGEQRRLLTIIIHNATWKDGKFEATLKTPFQKLRHSNQGSTRNNKGNRNPTMEMKNWLLR